MGVADALMATGLTRAGYRYINLDDGWALRRGANGALEVRTNLFPSAVVPRGGSSFRPFVERMHSMGLKAGIYTDIGRNTCAQVYDQNSPNLPQGTMAEREVGLLDHAGADMRLIFGKWRFDFIKVDACGITNYGPDQRMVRNGLYRLSAPLIDSKSAERTDEAKVEALYADLKRSIQAVRPRNDVVFSICVWGQAGVNEWGRRYGNSWRTSSDIRPRWAAMLRNFDSAAPLALYAGPGRWNDPDMLEFGNGDFDADHLVEARAHMSMWAVLAAPLILGSDVTKWPHSLVEIAGNRDVIAINQDPAGNQGVTIQRTTSHQVVVKTLVDGSKAIALINRGEAPIGVTVPLVRLNLAAAAVRDVWTGALVEPVNGEIRTRLAPHETALFRVSGRPLFAGAYLTDMPARIHVAVDGRKGRSLPSGWVAARANAASSGAPLTLGGIRHHDGLGVLGNSRIEVRLGRRFRRFRAEAGTVGGAARSMAYRVYGDGRLLAERGTAATTSFDVDVAGVAVLELVAEDAAARTAPVELAWAAARVLS